MPPRNATPAPVGIEVSLPTLGWHGRKIYGGPFRKCPPHMFGVKMAAEIDHPHRVSVPTEDFCVPEVEDLKEGLKQTLWALAKGEQVYVGCMGGIGRTGLFLAALGKVLGEKDPVKWVRANYKPHAVETRGQMQYIADLDVSDLQLTARAAKLLATCYWWVK